MFWLCFCVKSQFFFVSQTLDTFTLQASMLSMIQRAQSILQKILCTTVCCSGCRLPLVWYPQANIMLHMQTSLFWHIGNEHRMTSCLLSHFVNRILLLIVYLLTNRMICTWYWQAQPLLHIAMYRFHQILHDHYKCSPTCSLSDINIHISIFSLFCTIYV